MQYHWIVSFDEESGTFEIDWDTTQVLLIEDRGPAFDTNSQKWFFNDELMDADYEDYSIILSKALDNLVGK